MNRYEMSPTDSPVTNTHESRTTGYYVGHGSNVMECAGVWETEEEAREAAREFRSFPNSVVLRIDRTTIRTEVFTVIQSS